MTTPGPVVDSHHHVWDLTARVPSWLDEEQPWADAAELAALRRSFTVADLAPEAAAAGVTSTVVVQTAAEAAETPELLALAAGSGLIAGVVGWVDLTGPDVVGAIAALRARPGGDRLVGIRHPVLVEPDDAWLARPDVLRGLAAVAQAGLVYDVVCRQQQLPATVTAAGALPELTFVLDHMGNPGNDAPRAGPWAGAIGALGARPNVVAKLSGILSDAFPDPGHGAAPGQGGPPVPDLGHVAPQVRACFDAALRAFGNNRLMFGSDWPVCTLTARYADVLAAARALTAALSPAEQSAVFAGTARRVYRLGG
ncbi:MAG TPA: amidohydrolase family protein [Streptosporangiaceae bacterium]